MAKPCTLKSVPMSQSSTEASPIQPATEASASGSYVRADRLEKLKKLREAGVQPYPSQFQRSAYNNELQTRYRDLESGVETDDEVRVCGRIMALRNSGMFLDVMDESGKLQAFCHKDSLAEQQLPLLKLLDVGDFVGVLGTIRRTPRGELSVRVQQLWVLSKALLPLPEKYHGLSDVETRYRQRYLDLIVNEDSRKTLALRSRVVSAIRRHMEDQGFMEVETPMLHPIAGGATARPFVTHHNALDSDFYLRIAPELYLKKLIVGGLSEKLFEINRCFRNEGIDTRHNPEFTSLEAYQAYADYNDMMSLTERLVEAVVLETQGSTKVSYQGKEIDFKTPWQRKPMLQLVQEASGIDFLALDKAAALQQAKALGLHELDEQASWGHIVEAVFEAKVESALLQPTHVTDIPLDLSPLAKVHPADARLTERFESYANGWELINAFSKH
jgi:lysyl-tRNA synthetase class 2